MVDPTKVMVIHNTNYANSKTVADYYAAARSIPAGNVVGKDLGTTNVLGSTNVERDAYVAGLFTDIKTFCDANSIEYIILSTHCPHYFMTNEIASFDYIKYRSLCMCMEAIPYIVSLTPGAATTPIPCKDHFVVDASEYAYYPQGDPATTQAVYVPELKTAAGDVAVDIADAQPNQKVVVPSPYALRFSGRLGYRSSTATGASISADDVSLAQRIIDDAVDYEQNGDPENSPMLFGLSTRNLTYLSMGNVYIAYNYAVNSGMKNIETYEGNYDDDASSKYAGHTWGFSKPPITIPDQVTFLSGGQSSPVDVWGWVGTGFENNGSVYTGSVNFASGSWMFESTSNPVSSHSLSAGACAAVVPLQEPLSGGVPEIGSFFRQLLLGKSMTEASLSCQSNYSGQESYLQCEVWGDPLYTPFNNQKISSLGRSLIE